MYLGIGSTNLQPGINLNYQDARRLQDLLSIGYGHFSDSHFPDFVSGKMAVSPGDEVLPKPGWQFIIEFTEGSSDRSGIPVCSIYRSLLFN